MLAVRLGDERTIRKQFASAIGTFRKVASPFPVAVTLLEYGEWLEGQHESVEAQALLEEAEAIFTRLKARPWLDRLARTEWGSSAQLQAAGG
ncbi:MAG: hypothetical protein M3345_06790 [Actinomycetota bacterium]|nr:hypothetical protein [Actinomycetota bacterium]